MRQRIAAFLTGLSHVCEMLAFAIVSAGFLCITSAVGAPDSDRLLVKFAADAPPGIVRQLIADHDLALTGTIDEIDVKIVRAKPGKGEGVLNAINRDKGRWKVIYAEPDGEMQAVPLAVADGSEWYQVRIGVPQSWSSNATGAGQTVAVLDSGWRPDHPFLAGKVVLEKNFVANETGTLDNEGHGTACAGLVLSVARDARIVVGRVMSQNSAKWSAVSAGIIWAKDHAQVISISIGGTSDSFTLIDAIAKANSAGAVVVVAAGNAGTATPNYPAATRGAFAVSATGSSDAKSGFSSYGPHIAVAAPGEALLTTWGTGWATFSGTSGSTPIVAGTIAIARAHRGGTGLAAAEHIRATALDIAPAGRDDATGWGRVDLVRALDLGSTPPPPPDPEPDPEPPPPVEPPPATTGDITASASWTCTPAAYEAAGEGLANLTDGTATRKALWFVQTARATATFSQAVTITEIRVASANDHPVRDPGTVRLEVSADGTTWTTAQSWTGLTWPARFQEKALAVTPVTARAARFTLTSSGQTSPGGVIVQVGELRVRGTVGAADPPPPPEETWTEKRETVSVTSTAYAPAQVEQSRTTTTTTRIYEESNLGNIRNDRTVDEAAVEKRTVPVPVN